MLSRLLTERIGALACFANDWADRLRCFMADRVSVLPDFDCGCSNVLSSFLTKAVKVFPCVVEPAHCCLCCFLVVLTLSGDV